MKISILIPSVYRPERLQRCVRQVIATTQGHPIEIVCSLSSDDAPSRAALNGLPVVITAKHTGATGAVIPWNEAARAASGDIFALIGDDVMCQPGWLDEALGNLRLLGDGVVGLNDMARDDGLIFATHVVMTREYCRRFNGGVVFTPQYVHYYVDNELCTRANAVGKYFFAPNAKVEHQHPLANKARDDKVYHWAMQYYPRDEALFRERLAKNFPNDYEAIL